MPARLIARQRSETVGEAAAEGGRVAPPRADGGPRPRRAARWLRSRPTLAAALIYAVLAVVMVGQGLLPGRTLSSSDVLYSDVPWKAAKPADVTGLGANFELADSVVVFQPFAQYARQRLPDAPLWNPHISAGRPFLADTQNAVLSPFSWPSFVLPFWTSLAVVAALKLFVAALGTFVLARALGLRFGGALASGVVFAFGTCFVVWLAWPLTNIFPLIGWLLLLAELLVRRPGPLPAAGLAVLVALAYFGGHPETTFHALFTTGAFFLFRLLLLARAQRDGPRALARPVGAFVLALAAGTAMAAVLLVPFLELLHLSGDLARRQDEPSGFWPRKYLGALFLHDYWGRSTQQSNIEPFMQLRGWYAGALTLMLAAAALITRLTATRVALAVYAVFCTSMVLGLGPLFTFLTSSVPGFNTAHNQRMLIYVLLALALLAGFGLDELAGDRARGAVRRWLVLAASAGIFVVPVLWMGAAGTLTTHGLAHALEVAWGFVNPPSVDLHPDDTLPGDIIRMSALLQWLPLAGAGLVLVALRTLRGPRVPRLAVMPFVALAVVLLTVDLFRANMGFNPAIRTADAVVPTTGAIRYLKGQTPNRFVGLGSQFSFQPLPPDLSMRFGLYDARGYDYPAEKRYDRLWRRAVAPGVPDFTQPIVLATGTPLALRALSLLSVRDLLQETGAPAPEAPGLQVAYRGRDGTVYRNPRALPRTFLVGVQRPVRGEDAALAAVTAPGFDGHAGAVTERRLPGIPVAGAGSAPAGDPGRTALVRYDDERAAVDVRAARRSLLVLTDVHFPGWRAKVDGKPAPIERVDYLLRGVVVPPGAHRVEFTYAPGSFRIGWVVSVLATLGVLAAVLVELRRRRRAEPRPA